jgi:hypothetical protein
VLSYPLPLPLSSSRRTSTNKVTGVAAADTAAAAVSGGAETVTAVAGEASSMGTAAADLTRTPAAAAAPTTTAGATEGETLCTAVYLEGTGPLTDTSSSAKGSTWETAKTVPTTAPCPRAQKPITSARPEKPTATFAKSSTPMLITNKSAPLVHSPPPYRHFRSQ